MEDGGGRSGRRRLYITRNNEHIDDYFLDLSIIDPGCTHLDHLDANGHILEHAFKVLTFGRAETRAHHDVLTALVWTRKCRFCERGGRREVAEKRLNYTTCHLRASYRQRTTYTQADTVCLNAQEVGTLDISTPHVTTTRIFQQGSLIGCSSGHFEGDIMRAVTCF
jgi:hypothetical protein